MKLSILMVAPNVAVLTAMAWAASAPAAAYRITALDSVVGRESFGQDVNALGHVVGAYDDDSFFLYDGAFRALGGPAGTYAQAISDSGKIVGISRGVAFMWTPDVPNGTTGKLKNLGTLGGVSASAFDINSNGYVTGASQFELISDDEHAFLYDGVTMRDLGTLGGTSSRGFGINNHGWVTGSSLLADDQTGHAFLYDGTMMRDLGSLGLSSIGRAINSQGHVAGYYSRAQSPPGTNGFFYDGVTMWNISAPGASDTYPHGMNDLDQVVGLHYRSGQRAFLYTPGIGTVDLGTLIDPASGWELTAAYGINNFGQITGSGLFHGAPRAYLMTPVLTADFDGDDDVDGQDLANWKVGFGLSALAINLQGDADGDADVDGRDFLSWQQQRGSRSTAEPSTPVPELPSAVLMLLGCVSAATFTRRHDSRRKSAFPATFGRGSLARWR